MTGRQICYLIGFIVALLWVLGAFVSSAAAMSNASAVQMIQIYTEYILAVVIPYCFTRLMAGFLPGK